jgi:hypothetical protein
MAPTSAPPATPRRVPVANVKRLSRFAVEGSVPLTAIGLDIERSGWVHSTFAADDVGDSTIESGSGPPVQS